MSDDAYNRLREVVKAELEAAAHLGNVGPYQVDEVMLFASELVKSKSDTEHSIGTYCTVSSGNINVEWFFEYFGSREHYDNGDAELYDLALAYVKQTPVTVERRDRLVVVWDPERERYLAFAHRSEVPHALYERVTETERKALETLP